MSLYKDGSYLKQSQDEAFDNCLFHRVRGYHTLDEGETF
jgi:hypothetical protein